MGLREKRKASASWLVSRIATQPLTRVLSGIAVVALFVVGFGTAGADRFAVGAPPPVVLPSVTAGCLTGAEQECPTILTVVFRLDTDPVHVVAAARPMVKSLFHPQGIRDGYCINGYQKRNNGTQRRRAVGLARADALLLWNVGSFSGLPAWSSDSPYCRYDSDISSFETHPTFSPVRDEFRTLYWSYPAGTQDLKSVGQALTDAGYVRSATGWWERDENPWVLTSGDDKWLTRYSVAVLDSSQALLSWPITPSRDPQVDLDIDAARAIFATQPDALRLFEQAVDTFNANTPVVPVSPSIIVSPGLPFYWSIWPSPYLVYGALHQWQQAFLQVLPDQGESTNP